MSDTGRELPPLGGCYWDLVGGVQSCCSAPTRPGQPHSWARMASPAPGVNAQVCLQLTVKSTQLDKPHSNQTVRPRELKGAVQWEAEAALFC